MAGRLAGKVAVVTGGTAGIGLGTCKRFVKEGATVIFSARRTPAGAECEALLRDMAQGGEVHFVQGDIGVKEEVERVIDRAIQGFGRLDALINNAQGFNRAVPLIEKSDAHFRRSLESGVFGTKWAMERAFPTMKAQGGGSIVNMSSGFAWTASPGMSDYGTNKAGIEALTRFAAREWGRYNINVNVIAPFARSAMYENYIKSQPEAAARSASVNPLRRAGDPEDDLGGLCLGLVTEEARFVTGQTFDGSGGFLYLRRNASATAEWGAQ